MAIPTRFDGQLAAIEDAGSAVILALRTMQHAAADDLPRMRATLRDRLQVFVNAAIEAARRE